MTADIVVGLITGALAGLAFFGGLKWTVARLGSSSHPMLLAVGSFVVRSVVIAGLIVVVANGSLTRVLAALIGILVARTVLVSLTRSQLEAEEATWT